MKNNWTDRIGALFSLALIFGSPGIGYLVFRATQDVQAAWGLGLLAAIVGFIANIFTKVSEELAKRWQERIADGLDNWLQAFLGGFEKKYRQHIIYRHRFFDVRGLSTQNIFTLELDRVYISLSIAPRPFHDITTDLFRKLSDEFRQAQSVWKYLNIRQLREQNLVIIGPPGSGKTTMLKHIALALAQKKGKIEKVGVVKKLPIFLFLRDHARSIWKQPDISLPQVIFAHLKSWDLHSKVPSRWFESKLEKGKFLILLDGLDEVADEEIRNSVVIWVQQQMERYANNRFIITSRPYGYRSHQLKGVMVLEVAPFSRDQIEAFVHNWYLANEIMSKQETDEGVRQDAKKGAEDLMQRLRSTPDMYLLAENPLLLTMIATIHRYRSRLPGRRVELYKEIHEVFLGAWHQARNVELDMTPPQKQRVLQPLAYEMMRAQVREISSKDALRIITKTLRRINPKYNSEVFLKNVENKSGVLIERESGFYAFAHKTFQEYLASVYAIDYKLEYELVRQVQNDWWDETIRLYAAQTDASGVVAACLAQSPPSVTTLTLAIECSEEALEISEEQRIKLRRVLEQGVETQNKENRSIMSEALLALRVRRLVHLDDDSAVDLSLISHAEYQLFLDEMRSRDQYYYPNHWRNTRFPQDHGLIPVMGVSPSEAVAFCEWLGQRDRGDWVYRLPKANELDAFPIEENLIGYWVDIEGNYRIEPQDSRIQQIKLELLESQLKEDIYRFPWLKLSTSFVVKLIRHFELGRFVNVDSIRSRMRIYLQDIDHILKISHSAEIAQLKTIVRDFQFYQELTKYLGQVPEYDRNLPRLIARQLDRNFGQNAEIQETKISSTIHNHARNLDLKLLGAYNNIKKFEERIEAMSILRWIERHALLEGLALLANGLSENAEFSSDELMKSINKDRRNMFKKIADLYIDFTVLETRINGKTNPVEGIRIVKEYKHKR